MTLQKGSLNGHPIIEDVTSLGVPYVDVTGEGGDIIATNAAVLATRRPTHVVDTLADMSGLAAVSLIDGQTYRTLGAAVAMDGGGQDYLYHATGRGGAVDSKLLPWLRENGPGTVDWFERCDKSVKQLPASRLSPACLFRSPSLIVQDDIYVHSIVGDKGLITRFGKSVAGDARSIQEVSEGTPKAGFVSSRIADATSGLGSKPAAEVEYYHFPASAAYASWDYNGSIALDRLRLRVYSVVGSSGVCEIVRDRAGTLTTLGEANTDSGTTDAHADVTVTLSDTIIAGDKIRVSQKSGETLACRVQWFFAYSNTAKPSPYDDFLVINEQAITLAGSSLEWAYAIAPTEDTPTFVGNSSHQQPSKDVNVQEIWLLDKVPFDPDTKGCNRGALQVVRRADIDYNGTGQLFVGYEMTTSFTRLGVHCEHSVELREAMDWGAGYPAMFPALTSFSQAVSQGETLTLDVSDGSFLFFADPTDEVVIRSTPAGSDIRMKFSEPMVGLVWRNASYDKLYFRLPTMGSSVAGEELSFSWELMLE